LDEQLNLGGMPRFLPFAISLALYATLKLRVM